MQLLNRVGLCDCGGGKCPQCQLNVQAVAACNVVDELTEVNLESSVQMQNWIIDSSLSS